MSSIHAHTNPQTTIQLKLMSGSRLQKGNQWQGYKSRWEGCSSRLDGVVRFEHLPVHHPEGVSVGSSNTLRGSSSFWCSWRGRGQGEQETLLHTRCWALLDQMGGGRAGNKEGEENWKENNTAEIRMYRISQWKREAEGQRGNGKSKPQSEASSTSGGLFRVAKLHFLVVSRL